MQKTFLLRKKDLKTTFEYTDIDIELLHLIEFLIINVQVFWSYDILEQF